MDSSILIALLTVGSALVAGVLTWFNVTKPKPIPDADKTISKIRAEQEHKEVRESVTDLKEDVAELETLDQQEKRRRITGIGNRLRK